MNNANRSTQIAALIVTACLAGCASVAVAPNAAPQRRAGQSPDISVTSSATTGSVIFSQFDYTSYQRADITQPYVTPVGLGRIQVLEGQKLFESTVDGNVAWCSSNPTFFNFGDARSVCYFDHRKSGSFDQAYIVPSLKTLRYDVNIPYRVQDFSGGTGFKYEMLYQGFERGVIRITYREYLNDTIRPAFQQELSYTLDRGMTPISFRNLKIEVLDANNNEIRYRVLSAFK